MPADANAFLAALIAISEVFSFGAAMCRLWMPVWEKIHSSDVSNVLARSSFVTTCSGRYEPVPVIWTNMQNPFGAKNAEILPHSAFKWQCRYKAKNGGGELKTES